MSVTEAHPTVSVIVPVYNASKFVGTCIESVLSQEFTDFELILIDDGSTDGSGAICDDYRRIDNRIKVIHKENGGVSTARNCGIENACGLWLAFLDSDDYVEAQWLSPLSKAGAFDMVWQGHKINDGSTITDVVLDGTDIGNHAEIVKYVVHVVSSEKKESYSVPWSKFVKRSVVIKHDIRFTPGIPIGEDFIFNLRCLAFTNSLLVLGTTPYVYLKANSVLSHKSHPSYKYMEWCKHTMAAVDGVLSDNNSANDRVTLLYVTIARMLKATYYNRENRASRIKVLDFVDANFKGDVLWGMPHVFKLTAFLKVFPSALIDALLYPAAQTVLRLKHQ